MAGVPNRSRTLRLFLLGGLLGAAVFVLVFGLAPLNPGNDSFCRGGFIEKDIQQHYAGWLFYRQSSAGWPLCVTPAVNAPQGLSIAYTDSIPLFAALLRPLANALGGTFQYFGLFTLLCFILQGGFAALLCGLFAEGFARPLFGTVLFAASPVLVERAFRHTSLGAQFFVLGALYYYLRARREGRYRYAGLFLLNVLTIGIHPYFLPMTYAVTLAMLLDHGLRTRSWRGPAVYLAANLAGTALLGWALGLFYGAASSGGQALYGYFGMNLNALWNPAGVNGVDYSLFLPVQNQVGGNYDAFAYLGLGVLLALPPALPLLWRRAKSHLPLCAVCLILTLFAVSHVVTANGATLCTLPLPGTLIQFFSVFRSGGRLFWPVYYLLMLAAFAGLCRLRRFAAAAVVLAAAVQLLDITPGLAQRRSAMAEATRQDAFPTALESDFWQLTAGRYEHLASMDGIQDDALHLALYAADSGMSTNDPFAARYDAAALAETRAALTEELATGILREDTLYLFAEEGAFLQAVEPVQGGAWCGMVTGAGGACWYVIAPGMQNTAPDERCIPYGEEYPLRLADYTDALWNRGVLDETKRTVCFADSPFTRARLENAAALCAGGQTYDILLFDDSDPGWLMVTLDIEDATVLWGKELTTK